MTYLIKGSPQKPAFKILALKEAKIKQQDDFLFIEGYANTKNIADRYGDIPSVYPQKRNYVYDLTDFKQNPVLLIDHVNRLDHLAGSVVEIYENEKGLYFKALFSASNHPTVAHARQIYKEGHAKGISIAGRFHYENPQKPNQLTLAQIYEISLVAIPADPRSLATPSEQKNTYPELKQEIDSWLKELKKN